VAVVLGAALAAALAVFAALGAVVLFMVCGLGEDGTKMGRSERGVGERCFDAAYSCEMRQLELLNLVKTAAFLQIE
jgi:hypothetical protein